MNREAADPTNDGTQQQPMALLATLDERGWATLLRYTEAFSFQVGDVVLHAGDRDRSLCMVNEGRLEVLVEDESRATVRRIALIEEGSVFGEQSFLDGQPRSADIRGVEAGRIRVLPFAAFEQLCQEDPALAIALLLDLGRIVSQRLRDTTTFVGRLFADA